MIALAVSDVEVAFNPWLVVKWAGEIATNGHTQGITPISRRAERSAEAGVRAIGNDNEFGAHVGGASVVFAIHLGATDDAVFDDRCCGFAGIPERCARFDRICRHHLVEIVAAYHVAVGRKLGVVGPRHFEGDAVRDCSEAVVAKMVAQSLREAHVVELANCSRCESVAARFFARKSLLFNDEYTPTRLREPIRARCARGPATDNQCVVHLGCHR